MSPAPEPRPIPRTGRLAPGYVRSAAGTPRAPLAKLLDNQHGVLSRSQAITFGIGMSSVAYRIQPGGPWQPTPHGFGATLHGFG